MPQGIYPRKPKPSCSIPGCPNLNAERGLCGGHGWRMKTWGDPRPGIPLKSTFTVEQRFWMKVDASGGFDACWIWMASHGPQGHGQMQYGGRVIPAPRIAWMLLVGPIPDGLVLDHAVCQNPPCVNPSHLEPVTQGENVLRGSAPMAIAARRTSCQAGHEYTAETMYWYTKPDGRRTRRCRICALEWRLKRYRRLNPS